MPAPSGINLLMNVGTFSNPELLVTPPATTPHYPSIQCITMGQNYHYGIELAVNLDIINLPSQSNISSSGHSTTFKIPLTHHTFSVNNIVPNIINYITDNFLTDEQLASYVEDSPNLAALLSVGAASNNYNQYYYNEQMFVQRVAVDDRSFVLDKVILCMYNRQGDILPSVPLNYTLLLEVEYDE